MNGKINKEQERSNLEEVLTDSFNIRNAPTLRAQIASLAPPVAFSRMTNDRPQPGRIFRPDPEEAFVFQVPIIACADPRINYPDGRGDNSAPCQVGWSYLLDLRAGPTRSLDRRFDNIRLYIPQRAINEFAYQNGRRTINGLAQENFGAPDPVLFHLSQTLLPILEQPNETSSLFADYLALAFCEHVVTRYGQMSKSSRSRSPGLAPWQMRRIKDFFESNLQGNPSILDLARQCDLSSSYFTEAFKHTTGTSPHQWLLKRRIERAKSLLRGTDASLASIALDCGFFDQSHFSRVFTRLEGCRPSDWRLHNRSR